PDANNRTDYNSQGADCAVEPSKISGSMWVYVLNDSFDPNAYQDVDFIAYLFTFDAQNSEGFTSPTASGSASLAGSMTARVVKRKALESGSALAAGGQTVT